MDFNDIYEIIEYLTIYSKIMTKNHTVIKMLIINKKIQKTVDKFIF